VKSLPKYGVSNEEPLDKEAVGFAIQVGQVDFCCGVVLEIALKETRKPLLEDLLVETAVFFLLPDIDVYDFSPERTSILLLTWNM
jgi:hypothetical protein